MASNPFITQANPMMGQTLIDPESLALQRQKQYAAALLQQGQQPQGQMVSGRYVAPSFTQQLNAALNPLVGAYMLDKADTKLSDINLQNQELARKNIADALRLTKGGEETVYGAGMEGPTMEVKQIAPDSNAAIAKLLRPNATAMESTLGTKLLERQFKEPAWKEISQYNQETGNTENYRYDANSPNPRSTMQFLGVSKPALTKADEIRFRDEGINTNLGGANTPAVGVQSVVNTQVSPTAATTVNAPAAKPSEPSTKEYNYFKAPPPPANLSGKQAREFVSEQNKPLTGKANDTVNGAIGYQKSLDKLVNLFGQYSGTDMLKPNVKAEFKGALRTAQLQGKEAFGLGVLNGPDLEILEQVLVDPTAFDSFLKDRATINKLYNNQREFTSDAIKTNYRSAQKAVPENLRTYVEIKPIELKTETKSKPSTTTQRAVLNGENIIVKNGKWVYERTGKAVE
jgi:hypothetical protein